MFAGFDVEIFANRFLLVVKELEGETYHVWDDDPKFVHKISRLMNHGYTLVGFNSESFDVPVICIACAGYPVSEIKRLSNKIIEDDVPSWRIYQMLKIKEPTWDHVDLIEVAPGSFSSLKSYGARMNMPWLKDMPFDHTAVISDENREEVLRYCINDVDTTLELLRTMSSEMKLREDMSKIYGIDMRSLSDTQMAEQSFIRRLNIRRQTNKIPDTVTYTAPSYIWFEREDLTELLEAVQNHQFEMNKATGHVTLPDFLGKGKITIGNGSYQLGVGGIHSTHDKSVCVIASDEYEVVDIDAASYYPTIILNSGMYPESAGEKFLDEYREIYNKRLEAKRSGDKTTAETLKISVNGTFGKLSSKWSPLYSPQLFLYVTLTGQLTLLCMIEQLNKIGVDVISANTDGIAVGGHPELMKKAKEFVTRFEKVSGFEFEYTPYRAMAMKDCNNYYAVKKDKKVKRKGLYAPPDLKKNPTAPVCANAVANWLSNGISFKTTINDAKFVDFLSVRNVTGGAVQGDEFLGRVVRWYQTTDKSLPPLTYKKNGNKVPKTDGARAAMLIDKDVIPSDLDRDWYYIESLKIAESVGAGKFLTEEQRALIAPPPKKTRGKKS